MFSFFATGLPAPWIFCYFGYPRISSLQQAPCRPSIEQSTMIPTITGSVFFNSNIHVVSQHATHQGQSSWILFSDIYINVQQFSHIVKHAPPCPYPVILLNWMHVTPSSARKQLDSSQLQCSCAPVLTSYSFQKCSIPRHLYANSMTLPLKPSIAHLRYPKSLSISVPWHNHYTTDL